MREKKKSRLKRFSLPHGRQTGAQFVPASPAFTAPVSVSALEYDIAMRHGLTSVDDGFGDMGCAVGFGDIAFVRNRLVQISWGDSVV